MLALTDSACLSKVYSYQSNVAFSENTLRCVLDEEHGQPLTLVINILKLRLADNDSLVYRFRILINRELFYISKVKNFTQVTKSTICRPKSKCCHNLLNFDRQALFVNASTQLRHGQISAHLSNIYDILFLAILASRRSFRKWPWTYQTRKHSSSSSENYELCILMGQSYVLFLIRKLPLQHTFF